MASIIPNMPDEPNWLGLGEKKIKGGNVAGGVGDFNL